MRIQKGVSGMAVPWVEKYRPKCLDEISHQTEVVKMLKTAIEIGNMPHLLFYGPPGSGKTSSILALANDIFGKENLSDRILELNASDDRGINVVREKIKNWTRVSVAPNQINQNTKRVMPPWKILILDEADMMTSDAQSALRRIIEANSKTTRFVFICNYVHKIIDPIYSRCSKYRFQPISRFAQKSKLMEIIQAENVIIENEHALDCLLDVSQGDLRSAITLLQSASCMYDKINEEGILEIAGFPPKKIILNLLDGCKKSLKDTEQVVNDVCAEGWDAAALIVQLLNVLIYSVDIDDIKKAKISLVASDRIFAVTQNANEYLQLLALCTKLNLILGDKEDQY